MMVAVLQVGQDLPMTQAPDQQALETVAVIHHSHLQEIHRPVLVQAPQDRRVVLTLSRLLLVMSE